MRRRTEIEKLCLQAKRCQELAEEASDPEAAQTLRQLAAEIEAALPILEEQFATAAD